MKLDIFNHIFPKPFYERMLEVDPAATDMHKRVRAIPSIVDLDERFRIMDRFGDYRQVICLAAPADRGARQAAAVDGARATRERRHGGARAPAPRPLRRVRRGAADERPGRPAAGDASGRSASSARVGVQVYSNVLGRPLTDPATLPLFDLMAELDLPIWLHPARGAGFPDYVGERKSHYEIWWTFGWPYETSVAMAHIVFAGLFDKHPKLKIITHHMGGMIPYFEGRVGPGWDQLGTRTSDEDYRLLLKKLKKRPLDYFRMFYADTALFGAYDATVCGLKFFGADRVLFASDSPFDPEKGSAYIRWTIEIIDRLDLTAEQRHAIYEGNARRLCKLS